MAAYSLQRGHGIRRAALLDAFVRDSEDATYAERLKATIARLESKLRAIELIPLLEVDDPPPAVGALVEHDGRQYTVWRVTPSPFPRDSRRCAVLVRD